jgi:hypothetical protein
MQRKKLQQMKKPFKVVMWTVLSGDFDRNITPEQCLHNVLKNTESGSVIVFHDSEKAYNNLHFSLPEVLKYFTEAGYRFEKIVTKT